MASIRESIQTNRKILYFIIAFLGLSIGLFSKFYIEQKRENRALRLKMLSMATANKRTPKSWTQLTTKTAQPVQAAPVTTNIQTATTAAPVAQTNTADATPLADQDTTDLAIKLTSQMKRVKNLELATMDNNIAIADEIIAREPDSYGAYKAKLISLLAKEGKFNQPADEVEIGRLLESMAQFNISSDSVARREAALLGNSNSDIENIQNLMDDLANQKLALSSQIANLDANSPELLEVNRQIEEIDRQEVQFSERINQIEEASLSSSAQIANEDVVEIPFMRMLAQNDYEGVIDNAQSFINEFPQSPSGYFYLVKAMDLQGRKEEALQVIQNARLPQDSQQALMQRLQSEGNADPKKYWEKLTF